MAYGGRGAEVFSLVQEGDRLDDFVDGGAGIDGLGIRDGDINVRVDLRVTVRQETGVGGLTLQNVENLFTGDGWDQVTGNTENNVISTGLGNDTLEGGLGDDDLRGGDGNDTAIFSGSTRATVDLRLQGQAQNTGYGFDTLTGIESLVGGAGDDVFTGTMRPISWRAPVATTFCGRWRQRHAGRRDRHQHGSFVVRRSITGSRQPPRARS